MANCTYNGQDYSQGAVTCQNGNEFICDNGTWSRTGAQCSEEVKTFVDGSHCSDKETKLFAIGDGVYKIDEQGEMLVLTDKKLDNNCSGNACGFVYFRGDGGHGWNFTNRSPNKTIRIIPRMWWVGGCVTQQARNIGPGATINVVFGPIPGVGYAAMCLPFQADFT